VEGFKKASFFDKILPEWVEILSKTGGLNLLFCKPGTYLCLLFFYFFIFFLNEVFPLLTDPKKVFLKEEFLGKGMDF
jgi:hypothetical protein